MLGNFIKTVFRNMLRQKIFTFINLLGFSIGLTVAILIGSMVYYETSFDKFHKDYDQIYRVLTYDNTQTESKITYSITSGPLMESLKENFPEIISTVRLGDLGRERLLKPGEAPDNDTPASFCLCADSTFFDIFNFEIIAGNKESPLQNDNGVYLTEHDAGLIYPDQNPVGKAVIIMNEEKFIEGIIKDPPVNSHLQLGAVLKYDVKYSPVWWNAWINIAIAGYIKLQEGTDVDQFTEKLNKYVHDKGFAAIWEPRLLPLKDVHLKSTNLHFNVLNFLRSDSKKVLIQGFIGLLVLLIASFNYINMTSARAVRRAKETGIKKAVGAHKLNLITQYLSESVIMTLISTILAFALLELAYPLMDINPNIKAFVYTKPFFYITVVIFSVFMGVFSGIYPAIVITRYKTIDVLRNDLKSGRSGLLIRRILVVSQFTIAIGLMTSLLIAYYQLMYLKNVDLGYDRENVLLFRDVEFFPGSELLKQELRDLPFVESVAGISSLPGWTMTRFQVESTGKSGNVNGVYDQILVDDQTIETLNFRLLQGRNFLAGSVTDSLESVIVNESAVKFANWDNPLGQEIKIYRENRQQERYRVIGVVKDFNFINTRNAVNPVFMKYYPHLSTSLLIKMKAGYTESDVDIIKEKYEKLSGQDNSLIITLDDYYGMQFFAERDFTKSMIILTILAVIISSLGLFGLSMYITEQKIKEIGIRKIMGASIINIAGGLTKEFAKWVVLANVFAWPLAYFAMKQWISQFQYRVNINIFIFIIAGFTALLIAVLTVSLLTFRAARRNPVEALKYE